MSLNIFCFVYFLASTFPAVLSAPQTSDQTPNAILDGESFFKDAEDGGAPLNLFNPGNNVVVASKDDGFETLYTTDGPVLGGDSGGGVTFKSSIQQWPGSKP